MSDDTKESLLTFPCDFTIKVFGMATDAFEAAVFGIINQHVEFTDRVIQSNMSANGKYKALTLVVHVDSKDQLDNIYKALSSSPEVLMVL